MAGKTIVRTIWRAHLSQTHTLQSLETFAGREKIQLKSVCNKSAGVKSGTKRNSLAVFNLLKQ